jgi:hypothetical protein
VDLAQEERVPAKTLTPAALLHIARGELGTTELPPNSNRTKYGQALGLQGVAWCGEFVFWCFLEGGIDLRTHGVPGRDAASTNVFDVRLQQAGWKRVTPAQGQPGDIVFYNFGVTGAGDPANDDDHVGILVKQHSGAIDAIEGNTSPTSLGSQANGGGVYHRTRSYGLIRHLYRPPWDEFVLDDGLDWHDPVKLTALDAKIWGGDFKAGQEVAFGTMVRYPTLARHLEKELAKLIAASTAREKGLNSQLKTLITAVSALAAGKPAEVREAFEAGMVQLQQRVTQLESLSKS